MYSYVLSSFLPTCIQLRGFQLCSVSDFCSWRSQSMAWVSGWRSCLHFLSVSLTTILLLYEIDL